MQSPKEIEFWRQRWSSNDTPWDMQGVHPYLPRLLDLARSFRKSLSLPSHHVHVLVPACGRAHEARYLAELGMMVVAEDIAPEAIAAAQALHHHPNLVIRVGDS